jgi:hypothetical protein
MHTRSLTHSHFIVHNSFAQQQQPAYLNFASAGEALDRRCPVMCVFIIYERAAAEQPFKSLAQKVSAEEHQVANACWCECDE